VRSGYGKGQRYRVGSRRAMQPRIHFDIREGAVQIGRVVLEVERCAAHRDWAIAQDKARYGDGVIDRYIRPAIGNEEVEIIRQRTGDSDVLPRILPFKWRRIRRHDVDIKAPTFRPQNTTCR